MTGYIETRAESAPAVKEILDAGAALTEPDYVEQTEDATGAPIGAIYTVPDGYHIQPVDLEAMRAPYRDHPARKTGTVQVDTVDALVAYHAKHAEAEAEIWIGDRKIVDVLNAHSTAGAHWQDHRAILTLHHSPEWTRWTEISGKLLPQDRFAEFLEGAAVDVTQPDMAEVLEVAQSLEATTKVDFESAYRTTDGRRAFKYKETTTAKAGQRGELEIKERWILTLRVFDGQSPQPVVARFRYRITPDGLLLGIVIDRIPELLEQARLVVAADIEAGIDRGVVIAGSPS